MPTYDYYCISCGFEFEEFQSIASEPIRICPKCQGSHIKRAQIRKQEYLDIGRHWDLLSIAD